VSAEPAGGVGARVGAAATAATPFVKATEESDVLSLGWVTGRSGATRAVA
jgi:hypothetical protein